VVVAVEIQDAQTAKEAFGSDAVADSVGDADATRTAGTTTRRYRTRALPSRFRCSCKGAPVAVCFGVVTVVLLNSANLQLTAKITDCILQTIGRLMRSS
jgi:hypothetical protein